MSVGGNARSNDTIRASGSSAIAGSISFAEYGNSGFHSRRNDQRCIFHKEGLVAGSQKRFVTLDVPCLERLGDTLSHIDSQTVQRQVCKHSPPAEISQPPDWTRKSRRSIRSHGQPVRASLAEDWSTIKMAGWNI